MKTPKIFSSIFSFVFENKKMSWFWLLVRVYVGWAWLHAGYGKFVNPAWTGESAGVAISGFVNGALAKTVGEHPDVTTWYAYFLKTIVLPNAEVWSYMITYGEMLVGLGLIFGLFTALSAFFGAFMNMNFLLAGTLSSNPILLVLSILIMVAHKTAGWIGLDYFWKRKTQ